MYKILFVEDYMPLTKIILDLMNDHERLVITASTLKKAFYHLARHHFDLLILDRGLPDGDGLEILDHFQSQKIDTPVLMLSEKITISDRVLGLERGADDYMCKPFSMAELNLRIEKLLSKTKRLDMNVLQVGGIQVHIQTGLIEAAGHKVVLRKKEFEILIFLMRHKNRSVTREMVMNHIWSNSIMPSEKTVDVYIRRIRLLLGPEGKRLKTMRGFGYMIDELDLRGK